MTAREYYLTRDQIKVGDKVKINQLDYIKDTAILIKGLEDSTDYLGIFTKEGVIADIYNSGEQPNVDPATVGDNSILIIHNSNRMNWKLRGKK